MKNRLSVFIIFLVLLCSVSGLDAQKRYWVFFKDKDGVVFDPYAYFDPAAIQKRIRNHISLAQYSDLPLRQDYLGGVRSLTGELGTESRWFNAVAVNADESTLNKIKELPYVIGVNEICMVAVEAGDEFDSELSSDQDQLRQAQIDEFGAINFEEKGIDGKGVRIAVFDGGFPGVDKSPVFSHIRESGRIIATWDFVKKREFVYDYSNHGTSVLTCIAGILDDKKFGLATGAEFLLARTEVTREVFSEEENWLAAVEWADKNGADIISSSLGYTFQRYFPHDMDGRSTLVTRSANLAAAKGMLVVNAAGNDGDKDWEVIGAPADADSILSIGGISPDDGYHIKFSSYGPTYDGRMKPNLCSFGKVATSGPKKLKIAYGTSFATPLISGFAACVKQMHPDWDNMKLFDELQRSGHLYPYFDYAHGYGVPQSAYFTGNKPEAVKSFSIERDQNDLKVKPVEVNEATSVTETEDTGSPRYFNLDENILYYRIVPGNSDRIRKYAVVRMNMGEELVIPADVLQNGDTVEIHFRGYTEEYKYTTE
jgi:serine protease AprX